MSININKRFKWIVFLFTGFILFFNHSALSKVKWKTEDQFLLSLEKIIKNIENKEFFFDKKELILNFKEELAHNIRFLVNNKKRSTSEAKLLYALNKIDSYFTSLEIKIFLMEESDCPNYMRKLDRFFNNEQKKKESPYQLIRALCHS